MLQLEWTNILFTVINLLILFVALRIFLFKPVQKIISERQAEADRQFEEAANSKAEAMELKSKYTESLENAKAESEQTIQDARRTADTEYQRIVADAENVAKQIKVDAKAEAENEKAQIIKSAQKEIADMVVDAAGKVVGGASSTEINTALYDEFLNKAGD